ncbi:MAG TPA: hypothetical protein VHX11_12435 [Acidobacteriaceae bacterium]|jgi:hypothetical protein|nr:hypothetical protein [Acidobacteriaceae bacterium]
MNRIASLLLTLPVLAGLPLAAQTATAQTPTSLAAHAASQMALLNQLALLKRSLPENACPSGIQVREAGIPRLLLIQNSEGKTTGIRITLDDTRSVGITAAQVTVHGYTSAHAVTMAGGEGSPGETQKSVSLAMKVPAHGSATSVLWVPGFVSVTAVDLEMLTYADGSIWTAQQQRPCMANSGFRELTGSTR